ncbi:hypothetical protein CDD82_7972 [Ophiocordyceps australis]|uniref:Alpha-L-rhamnosidase six-hairpin glycosidase domain-containing protein n=1 Tax=Ophiocordyceps australis TaxID=1399860 RepID=A0A2C5YNQ3_9HYPO|nr:hypothetical protein CDD82_7972 [Ophiocordyceps australis]
MPATKPPSWHKFIQSPGARIIKPVDIVDKRVNGTVKDPYNFLLGEQTFLLRRSVMEDVPSVVVDFGRVVVGTLEIDFGVSHNFSAGRPGVRLAFSETLEFLSDRSDYTRSDSAQGDDKITNGTDQIAVGQEPYTWRNVRGCQFGRKVCADGPHGFRYVQISLDALRSDSPHTSLLGLVSITAVRLRWSGYLGTKESYLGWVESPRDKDLTQWWYDAVYTAEMAMGMFGTNEMEPRVADNGQLQATSPEGHVLLMDGAKRNREPHAVSLAIAALTMYIAHGEYEAARNTLQDLAPGQRDEWITPEASTNSSLPLFDSPLWWVVSAVDHVLYTGNTSFAEAYWKVMTMTLDDYYHGFLSNDTGMLHKPADMDDYASIPRSGPVTYYNALYVYALRKAGHLAMSLGKTDDANRWYTLASHVAHALWMRNFDIGHGAFYDGSACPGADIDTICDVRAQDGNMLAILAGITDDRVTEDILEYWFTLKLPWGSPLFDNSTLAKDRHLDQVVYPFISYFEYAARLSTKTFRSTRGLMSMLHKWMAEKGPEITTWEAIGLDGKPLDAGFTSMAHGSSTGLVSLLSNYDLGIRPLEPGFKTWHVCPSYQLTATKGVMPTPQGPIKVVMLAEQEALSAKKLSSRKARMHRKRAQIEAPYGTTGKICLPFSTPGLDPQVSVNGYTVWTKKGPTTYVEPHDSGMKIVLQDRVGNKEYEVYLPRAEVDTVLYGWNPYAVKKQEKDYAEVDLVMPDEKIDLE